ncbi:MAG: VOC family protein [Clostridiales bacterium]|jgi:uncharacterized glyoxalase superfamily protein PhnB|nr:VOC family protein [Clostridiales bacterium]
MTRFYNHSCPSHGKVILKGDGLMYKSMTANLMVESVDDSVEFYQNILGFSVVASVPNESGKLQFAILSKDNLTLMLQDKGNLTEEYPILNTDKVRPSVTLYIMADNFDEFYHELKERHEILRDAHTTFYGSKEFAIADNNGYVLTFAENHEG